jgi:predicted DNA-binding transcriptional regulator AlpA
MSTEPILPIQPAAPDSAPTVEEMRGWPETGRPSPFAAVAEPLLVPAGLAGAMCGRSEASWWRDHAARRVPAPVRLGGRTLWRTDELRRWVAAGCPSRPVWEAQEKARQK